MISFSKILLKHLNTAGRVHPALSLSGLAVAAGVGMLLAASSVPAGTPGGDDFGGLPYEPVLGRIYIQILPAFAPLTPTLLGDIAYTGISSLDAVADRYGVTEIRKAFRMKSTPTNPKMPDLSRYYIAFFPEAFPPAELVDAYNRCPELEDAEAIPVQKKLYVPNDTRYNQQWHLDHCGFPGAWDVSHGGGADAIIGIVDSGIDMDADEQGIGTIHPDLEANLWINPGEDINNDGVIDPDDWNGRDDDDNGYVDDFYGWDITGRDNWPDDPWGRRNGHGTHVAGIASAVTDNDAGVSGAGFNCKLMIAGCYDSRTDSMIVNADQGIEYCVDNGASAINLSYGHFGRSSAAERQVINYALTNNVSVFAGAGNDNAEDLDQDDQHFYPCAYNGVIGVGASDERDLKSYFSNYGDFTDLIAPGETILSTFPRGEYEYLQGTSMSSPLACGLGALLLSVKPDLEPDQVQEWMQRTAVDISENNPDYPGIIYRIDADFLLNSTHPEYAVSEWTVDEANGNHNGWYDPNETVYIGFTLANAAGYFDATSVIVRLENNDSLISIGRGEAALGDLVNGNQVVLSGDSRLSFTVDGNSVPHYSTFTVIVTSGEGWIYTTPLELTIGHPFYLLVDDDDGDAFQNFYKADFDSLQIVHDSLSVGIDGLPDQNDLNGYDFVVWETGNARNALPAEKQELLAGFLNQRGCLLLSGQFIGDDHGGDPFFADYLHARHVSDNTGKREAFGITGNPISDGMNLLLQGSGGGSNSTSPSSMEPLDGAVPLLYYGTPADPGEIAAISYEGQDFNVVYCGFALEAVSGGHSTTLRREFIRKVFHRFTLGVDEEGSSRPVPAGFELCKPYPNPFNAVTSIQVRVPQSGAYRLEVIDLKGRRIALLHNGNDAAGIQDYCWDGSNATAGIYFFRLGWDGGTLIQKAALIK